MKRDRLLCASRDVAACRFGGELPLEVHEIAAKHSADALNASYESGVRWCGQQVGLSENGELRFSFDRPGRGGAKMQSPEYRARIAGGKLEGTVNNTKWTGVRAPLLWCGVASISVRYCAGGVEGREHELVGYDLGFAARALSRCSDDIGAEGNGLLPHFEIAHASGHGSKMETKLQGRVTSPLHTVRNDRTRAAPCRKAPPCDIFHKPL